MSIAKITLWGMQKYMTENNDSLFADVVLPAGMDKDLFIESVLDIGAEFEVLYADPDFIKDRATIWAQRHYHMFERWVKALSYDYNPLENYDRQEEWSEGSSRQKSGSGSSQNNSQHVSSGNSSDSATDEHKVSAFNTSAYQNSDQDSHTASSANTASMADVGNTTAASSENEQSANIHTGRTHGNIGVTTSQQMLEAEWNVAKLNLYREAAELFCTDFCIYVY